MSAGTLWHETGRTIKLTIILIGLLKDGGRRWMHSSALQLGNNRPTSNATKSRASLTMVRAQDRPAPGAGHGECNAYRFWPAMRLSRVVSVGTFPE